MTPSRLRAPDLALGFFAAALAISLWATWYSSESGGSGGRIARTGWEALSVLDVVLVVTTALVGLYLVSIMAVEAAAIPVTTLVLATTLALAATIWVLIRLVVTPAGNSSLEPGIFIALAGSAGVFACGIWAMRDETSPGVPSQPEPELFETPAP